MTLAQGNMDDILQVELEELVVGNVQGRGMLCSSMQNLLNALQRAIEMLAFGSCTSTIL